MKKHFKKIAPDQTTLQNSKMLKPIAGFLTNPKIWHFNRRSIATGIAIGLFFGALPIAGQMLLAAVMAVAMRVNMPAAVVATWISNPLTMPFFYTANYYFGAWLLDRHPIDLHDMNWSLEGLLSMGGEILVPLFFGSIVVGVILSAVSFLLIRMWWRIHIILSHRTRRIARKAKAFSQVSQVPAKPPQATSTTPKSD